VQVGVRKNAVNEGKNVYPGFGFTRTIPATSTDTNVTMADICIASRLRVIKTYRYPLLRERGIIF
jgi:hypothetical protein